MTQLAYQPIFEEKDDEQKPPRERGIEQVLQKRFLEERKVFFWTTQTTMPAARPSRSCST
jgi:hypothetical protein